MVEDFLKEDGSGGFKSEAWYNPYGDCIDYQTVDDAIVADRIDSLITLHRSATDGRVIGFQIKGVRKLLKSIGADAMAIGTGEGEDASIKVIVLVLAALQTSEEKATRDQFDALSSLLPDVADKEIPIPRAA